jgi:DNA polymerase III gamma/tau subunit
VRSTGSTQLIEVSEHYKKRYEAEINNFSEQDLLRYIKQTNELDQALRWATQPRYRLESGLIQMVKMESSMQIGELFQQIDMLKKKISNKDLPVSPAYNAEISSCDNSSSTELKVVGEVGAGYLKSKSAVSYSSLIGTDLTKFAGVTKVDELKHFPSKVNESSLIVQAISSAEVTAHWSDFINGVSESHIAVGTTLKETQVLDVHNGMVRIACPDDYHFATLKRHKELLAKAFHQVVGKHVAIEPVLHLNADIPVKVIYKTISPAKVEEQNNVMSLTQDTSAQKEHPILTLLKRELGAERLE